MHEISTEEFSCPPELIDGLRGTNQYDDFYGIGNHCYRSVLTLKYRALGQNGEYVCQVTAQEGVAVEMPIRFHFPLGYPLERLVRLRVKQEEESTCVANLVAAAHNLSRQDLVQRLNDCPRNTRLLTWLSSNAICAGAEVELNCAYTGLMMQIGGDYLRMLSLSDLQTDAQLIDWVRSVSGQVVSGPDPPQGVLLFVSPLQLFI
ncbi:unnamed protein product [Dibothriocephalus latus]|uniref:Uncharacterized protein n=1 Tax=Dibothriocephalus latus TaxID=60516 RepID=A0A3P7M1I7_DIBLA|nr:unnamed protein product [Dibothriocephalus latus]